MTEPRRRIVPTPIHGWRVFAGEVGVIVLGVLIALGAQELVTGLNERQRADDAMAAIRSEVAKHDFAAAEIEIATPCIAAQAEAIQKRLVAGDPTPLTRYTDNFSSLGFVVRAPTRVWGNSNWTSIRDTDVLRELEPRFAELVADHYAQAALQAKFNRDMGEQISALNALALMMPRDEAERLRLIQTAEMIRSNVDSLDLVGGQIRDRLAAVGLSLDPARLREDLAESGTIKFCRDHDYPLAKLRTPDPTVVDG